MHLDQHLAALGVAVTAKDQRLLLSRTIIQAEIDALIDIRKTDDSRYRALTDRLGVEAKAAAHASPEASDPLLSVAAADWVSEKSTSSWSARRKDACKAALALFLEIAGDKPISSYAKAEARTFKSVLSNMPPNRSKLRNARAGCPCGGDQGP